LRELLGEVLLQGVGGLEVSGRDGGGSAGRCGRESRWQKGDRCWQQNIGGRREVVREEVVGRGFGCTFLSCGGSNRFAGW